MDNYYSLDYETFDSLITDDYDEILMRMQNKENLAEVWSYCIEPTLFQILPYFVKLIGLSFLFRIGWTLVPLNRFSNGEHFVSFFCGTILLYLVVDSSIIYLISFSIITYIMLQILLKLFNVKEKSNLDKKNKEVAKISFQYGLEDKLGITLGMICILGLIICEITQGNAAAWHQIRGIQMIFTMKAISLAFDFKNIGDSVSILSYFGYLFCPANCILGPWIPYIHYFNVTHKRPKYNLKWIFWTCSNLIASLIFLLLSNCFISLLLPNYTWKWLTAFKDALSFRNSHYFISFLSQATLSASGIFEINFYNYKETNMVFGFIVTQPWKIEFPKSLVQVVVNWNLPMHRWLKSYVFEVIRPYSIALALFITYLISSLLHGLNLRIYAVLLTLGLYTYIEYKLRKKLSQIFNACISATECKQPCSLHVNSWSNCVCLVTNIFFSVLTVINLSYLGAIFEGTTSLQEEGYSMEHTLNKWQNLDFCTHWTVLILYIFYYMI